jgi:DNA adenine methylase
LAGGATGVSAMNTTSLDLFGHAIPAEPIAPPLKYAGGKTKVVPYVLPFWELYADRRLVEPFCGALGMTLGLRPNHALLNDANPALINFHKCVQHGLVIDLPMRYDEALYYEYRDRFNSHLLDSKEKAELFSYLNQTCFNGLCRFNQKGAFNTPFGKYTSITYKRDFLKYVDVFENWEFTCGDFETVNVLPDDFLYADPPYDGGFTEYTKEGFDWSDQVRLARWLAKHSGPVVASNQATDRIVTLYKTLGFELEFLDAPRRISANGERVAAREMLARRNIAEGTNDCRL